MKAYDSLFKLYKDQPLDKVFAHFYPIKSSIPTPSLDFDASFKSIAEKTIDGYDSWEFQQPRFKAKYSHGAVPKLKNYLNYTFVRLAELEQRTAGYFLFDKDQEWVCFNTGLHNAFGADLLAVFQKYKPNANPNQEVRPDWVYKGCYAPNDHQYRTIFGTKVPDIAWYSNDSADYVFNTSYNLDKDAFDHLFERAKERAGLPNATDEVVRNYLRGTIENLVPKIRRNYKIAIPVYFVEEKRMQLLLPFGSASSSSETSCFLVERDDANKTYHLKTIFDLDQAYFSARLITRPDKEWLNP
jgi:ribosomal protein S30